MKPLLPTLKENPRYVLFRINSKEKFSQKDTELATMKACKQFLGELGIARAGIFFVREKFNKSDQTGVIRTNSKNINETKAALALIKTINNKKATVTAEKVSGIIRKL
tara:strand:- start:133 stop:456 length:324 start_codon:yes stop_codon:yes gene_type:complete